MNKRGAFVLAVCFFALFTLFAIRYSYGLLLPEMVPSLMISKTDAGVIYSSFFIAYAFFSPVAGLLADRINIRVLLAVFSTIFGMGTFLMAHALSIIEASCFFALAGIGASACWTPVLTLAQRWISDKHRGMTLAFITAGGALGTATSSLVIPLAVMAFSWRIGWEILSSLAFVLADVSFVVVRNNPGGQSEPNAPKYRERGSYSFKKMYVREGIGDIRFWLMGISYMLVGFSVLIPFTFLSIYAVQEFRLPYENATRLITVIAVASIAGRLFLGSLSDLFGRIRFMMLSGLLIAAGCFGIVFHQGSFTLLNLSAFIFGCGHGAVWPLYIASASDYFSKRNIGGIIGMWSLLMGIGSIFCPTIAGWIADTTGTFAWSFILAGVTAIISSFLLLPVRKISPASDL